MLGAEKSSSQPTGSERIAGYCPICEQEVVFIKTGPWLRGQYLYEGCGSIPCFRALIDTLNRHLPTWRESSIHESSPAGAASAMPK